MSATPSAVERPLNFSTPYLRAALVRDAVDYTVEGRTIVVNPGVTPVTIAEEPRKTIPPLSSTVLADTRIEKADALLLLRTAPDGTDITGITAEPGWSHLADLLGPGEFPRETALYRSPQDDINTVLFDPAHVLGERGTAMDLREFNVRANLWFSPAGTDCAVHNQHDFIEVHTQVHGLGRMQRFRDRDHASLYQDVLMSPGYTTPDPFCATGPQCTYHYPWHQYRADTDCIWLAIEYHPVPRALRTLHPAPALTSLENHS
ncbi:hypothetical protein ACFVZ8_26390 [Streptomyces sp. NPDC059558]|uniref:hypothetical protein n=1 Tax=unclassified Streptomyces TaxID=2593676 RepID=UPI00068E1787|nr:MULTISPECIES: hypothetical protein [unclassified Streptomyces]ARE77731.1 hypothetical protein B6R96_30440 [Streptomyces sp. Sge12]